MATRYDASMRNPGQPSDPLQAVDPWRRQQAGDPGQRNLDAWQTVDPWRSYVPLSATSNSQVGSGCFVTRTEPVPGGSSTPMAFSGGVPPGFSQSTGACGPHPGLQQGSCGAPQQAWFGGSPQAPGGYQHGCGLQGGLQQGFCGAPVHGGAMPMNGYGACGFGHFMPHGFPMPHGGAMPFNNCGQGGGCQQQAGFGGSPNFGGGSPTGSPQGAQQQQPEGATTGPSTNGPGPSTASTTPGVGTATEFAGNLNAGGGTTATAHPAVTSAFEALGKAQPAVAADHITSDEAMKNLVMALGGERRNLPTWSGAPNMLRSWLKSLAFWERDNGTPKSKWGIKLYQALSDDARRIAETVPTEEILTERGYGLILTALLAKYKPYLEAVGPVSVDNFLFTGDRQKGESFATFIARKEVQLQELENQIGATLHPLIAGRILLRQSYLTELQKDMP